MSSGNADHNNSTTSFYNTSHLPRFSMNILHSIINAYDTHRPSLDSTYFSSRYSLGRVPNHSPNDKSPSSPKAGTTQQRNLGDAQESVVALNIKTISSSNSRASRRDLQTPLRTNTRRRPIQTIKLNLHTHTTQETFRVKSVDEQTPPSAT